MQLKTGLFKTGGLCLIASGTTAPFSQNAWAEPDDPEVLHLTGVVRDFRGYDEIEGHASFERESASDFGIKEYYIGNLVEPDLGPDGRPRFSGRGIAVRSPWKDAAGFTICPCLEPRADDRAGDYGLAWNDFIDSAEQFDEWFNDVPGVNISAPLTLSLKRRADGMYVFDSDTDAPYDHRGGFFPIDGLLLGNSPANPAHNYHFTVELHARFTYDAGAGQIFELRGDDDVWVFIDGRLVVDVGGRHAPRAQHVELDRLGLEDGETYTLDLFSAERRTSGSNLRIATNLPLETAPAPVALTARR